MKHTSSLPAVFSEQGSATKISSKPAPPLNRQQQSNNKSSYLPSPTRINQTSKSQSSLFSSPSKKLLVSRSPPPLQEIANQNTTSSSSYRTSYRARPIYSMKDLLGSQHSQVIDCDDDTFSCDNSPCISKAPSFASNNNYWSSSTLSTSMDSPLTHRSSSNLLCSSTRKLKDLSQLQRRQSTISEVSQTPSQANPSQAQPQEALQKQPSCIQKDQVYLRALLLHTSPLYSPRSTQRMKQLEQLLDYYETEHMKPVMDSIQALKLQLIKEKESETDSSSSTHNDSKILFQPIIVSKKPFTKPSSMYDDTDTSINGLEEIKETEKVPMSIQQSAQERKMKKVSMFVTATRSSLFMNHLRKKSMDFQHQLQQKQWQQKIKRIVQRLMQYITYHSDTSQGKITVAQLVQVLCHPPETFLQKYFHRVHRLQLHWQRQHITSYLLHAPTHLEHDHGKQHISLNPSSPSTEFVSCAPFSSPHNNNSNNKTRFTQKHPSHNHHLSLLHQQHLQKSSSTSTSRSYVSHVSIPRSPSSHVMHTFHNSTSNAVASPSNGSSTSTSMPKLKRRSLRQHLNTTADPSVIAHIPKSIHFTTEYKQDSGPSILTHKSPTIFEISPLTKQVVDYVHNNTTWWMQSPLTMLSEMIVNNHKHSEVSITHWFDALIPPFPLEDTTFPQATAITMTSFVNAVSVISSGYFNAINLVPVDHQQQEQCPLQQQQPWSEVDIVFLFFLITLPHYPTYHVIYERFISTMLYVSQEKPFGSNAELYTLEQYRRRKLQDKVTLFLEMEGNALTMSRFSLTYALSSIHMGKAHPEEDVHAQHLYLVHSKWIHKRGLFQQNLAFHLNPNHHHPENQQQSSHSPQPMEATEVDVSTLQFTCPVFEYIWDVALIHHEIFHVSFPADKHHHDHDNSFLDMDNEDTLFSDELKDDHDSPRQHPSHIHSSGHPAARNNHNNNHTFCERLHVTRQIRALATTLLHATPFTPSHDPKDILNAAPSRTSSLHNMQHILDTILLQSTTASPTPTAGSNPVSTHALQEKEAKHSLMASELTRFILRQYRHIHNPARVSNHSNHSHNTIASASEPTAEEPSNNLLLSLQGDVTHMLTTLCTLFLQHQQEKKLLHTHVDTFETATASSATALANHQHHHSHPPHPRLIIDTAAHPLHTSALQQANEDDPFRLVSCSSQAFLSPKIQAYLQTVSESTSSTSSSYSSVPSPTTSIVPPTSFALPTPIGSFSPNNNSNNINNKAFVYRSGDEKARFLLQTSPFKK